MNRLAPMTAATGRLHAENLPRKMSSDRTNAMENELPGIQEANRKRSPAWPGDAKARGRAIGELAGRSGRGRTRSKPARIEELEELFDSNRTTRGPLPAGRSGLER